MMWNTSRATPEPDANRIRKYAQLVSGYERLMEINHHLNSTFELPVLLKLILDAATEICHTEQASILLVEGEEMRFVASTDMSPAAMAAMRVPMEGSVSGWVARHNEHVLVTDTRHDKRFFSQVDQNLKFSTRNILAVPMTVNEKVIGVLSAVNKSDTLEWDENDVMAMKTLAAQAAVAIENTRLFRQNDFIAEMVHELRAPLNALRASLTLLLHPALPTDKKTEIILTTQSETERLSQLATDFLDWARLESGRVHLDKVLFDVIPLIEESLMVVQAQAQERGIGIEIDGEEAIVLADRSKVKQVLLNLFTNAVKYNREGGKIACLITPPDHERFSPDYYLQVAVRDTGMGISEEDQQRMFEKFFRAANSAASVQGTGLGLPIARRIVQAHGGDMWLRSQLGTGTTFYFTLPLPGAAV